VQLISTSRHITQGWVDLMALQYSEKYHSFSGRSKVVRNDRYSLRFAFPRGRNFVLKSAKAMTSAGSLPLQIANHDSWAEVEMIAPQSTEVNWEVAFTAAEHYHFPTKPPQNLWAERVGFDGVNLRWTGQHQPYAGYLVSLNGELLGFTSSQIFPLRNLSMDSTYEAEVRTAWQDGNASANSAELKFTLKPMVPDELYLSDLEPHHIGLEWRHAEFNRTVLGKGMVLGGRQYERGLGIPPNTELGYELKGFFQTFSALVGIDDEHNREGHVEFMVLGDGKALWRSGFVTKANGAIPVQLDITGVNRLILRVNRGEKGGGGDQANWVEAKIGRSNEIR
jgi:hypothetical protein